MAKRQVMCVHIMNETDVVAKRTATEKFFFEA